MDERNYTAMFEPVTLLPEQFHAPSVGENERAMKALMRAILEDAEKCYNYFEGTRGIGLHREAADWISSEDERWPFSFVNVCRTLGLDPAYLRRKLKEKLKERKMRQTAERLQGRRVYGKGVA